MLRKIGKYYHVDISHPSLPGRLRFTTKTSDKYLAQRIHDKAYREVLENSISGYHVKSILFKHFVKEFLKYSKINHTYNTQETYKYAFKKFLSILPDDISLKNIDPSDAERLKSIIPNKTTYNIYYNHLKAAFNYAIKWKYIKNNPFNEVSKFKVNQANRRNIHLNEFEILIKTILNDDQLFAEFIIFMFIIGARRNELLNLKWNDVHFEQNYIELRNTKGKKDAYIPLNHLMTKILKNRSHLPQPFNYRPDYASKKFKWYCKKAGLPSEIVLHSLRHSTTTVLFEQHEDPLKVQYLVRHKDLATTLNYTHTTPSFLTSAIDKTSDLIKTILKDVNI